MARWAEVTEAAKNLQILELEVGESVSGPESSSACEPNLVFRNQNTEPALYPLQDTSGAACRTDCPTFIMRASEGVRTNTRLTFKG